jgi:predicted acylesterase/phospholipase RssA
MSTSPRPTPARRGIALAGGGPEGAIYEIGALRALDEAVEGFHLDELDIYVGVSAGAFVAACLANGLRSDQLCRAIISHEPGEHPFIPETFLAPAYGEFARRTLMVPGLLWEALRDYVVDPADLTLRESLIRVSRALPAGLFDNSGIRRYLEQIFRIKGRTDDFRQLRRRLVLVAADLDSGQPVLFGDDGFDDLPISLAVQASTALPGLYPPVLIDGRYYVDGVLLKTVHASVALDHGVDLLVCVNPIVPVDTARAVELGVMKRGHLVDRGLPTIMSQSLRTMIHSRLVVGMSRYGPRYPGSDVLLIEPRTDDYEMFFKNVFSFAARKATCEHAYRATLAHLRERQDELAPLLARHGLRLRQEVIDDEDRDLWRQVGLPRPVRRSAVAASLEQTLDRLQAVLDKRRAGPEPAPAVRPPARAPAAGEVVEVGDTHEPEAP